MAHRKACDAKPFRPVIFSFGSGLADGSQSPALDPRNQAKKTRKIPAKTLAYEALLATLKALSANGGFRVRRRGGFSMLESASADRFFPRQIPMPEDASATLFDTGIAQNQEYGAEQIDKLEGLEAVRKR